MQAAATPGNPAATQKRLPVGRHPAKKYQKVLDARKRPIRGLWIRGDRYYARLRVPHPDTGVAQVRRVPLPEAHSPAEAQAQLRRLLTQRVDNALPSVRLAPKFRDYVEEYFAYYAQAISAKRPKTISTERTQLNAWTEHLGDVRLHQINRAMINAFIAKRQAGGASPRTVNLGIVVLRNVLKRAIDDNWIRRLPTENLRPLKCSSRKRDLFSGEDIERLCKKAVEVSKNGIEFADYIRVMAACGSRMSETLRLKWSDVDWQNQQLTIGSDGLAKNHESRVVDFHPRLEGQLKDMLTRRAPDSDWLFPSPLRGEVDRPTKTFRQSLRLARTAAELPNFGFHDCRHFFISMCVMSGIDFMTIARWVGHRDGGVLIGKIYGHLNNEHTKRQAQRIEFK